MAHHQNGLNTLVRDIFFMRSMNVFLIFFSSESLPTRFDTPMFWNEHDLAELKGTSLVGQFFTIYFAWIFP